MQDLANQAGVLMVTLVAVPWCIWVTVSLFNQRQEIALLKQIFGVLRSAFGPKFKPDP